MADDLIDTLNANKDRCVGMAAMDKAIKKEFIKYDDPNCIHTVEELERFIEEIGLLPLFKCEIPGFSVEEHTAGDAWWTEDPERDPWEWRKILAARGNVAYGKFFDRKAGFVSRTWLPDFVNYRRDGYDFDSRWEDELASRKSKKIMDLFAEDLADRELYSFEVKEEAGYGRNGEKNFEGEITNLQMQMYLCIRDFRRRKNKSGGEYGWGIAVYCTPEHIWGRKYVTGAYCKEPAESALKIFSRAKELFPDAEDRQLRKVLGIRNAGAPEAKKVLPYPDNLIKALKIEGLTAETLTDDQKAGLEVAIGQLKDKQQKVIDLKYRKHWKNEEIGRVMNRAAGTIGTYHTKAMRKLKWPSVSAWYTAGYEETIRSWFADRNLPYLDMAIREEGQRVSGLDYCLRLGLSLKQFEILLSAGIKTVFDLVVAAYDSEWYRPLRGIGKKTAEGIEKRLDERYIQQEDCDI